jgi:hypothetical protein
VRENRAALGWSRRTTLSYAVRQATKRRVVTIKL